MQYLFFGSIHEWGKPGQLAPRRTRYNAPLRLGRLMDWLREGSCNEG